VGLLGIRNGGRAINIKGKVGKLVGRERRPSRGQKGFGPGFNGEVPRLSGPEKASVEVKDPRNLCTKVGKKRALGEHKVS